jgi:predicted transposase/invertase (TIGR01784 family)
MAKQLKFPHDSGYKELLSCNQLFLELLDSFVDQGWVKAIDRDKILLLDKSFIEEEFVRIEADLVYQLQLNGKEVIFYLLMELQSTNCFQMPYRLLQYMAAIWRYYFKSHYTDDRKDFCLPVIVPIVVYNGGDNWTACRNYKEILTQAELFGEYVVDFKYILIDVNRYSETDLWELANLIGGVFLLDQKVTPDIYHQRMLNLAPILKHYGKPVMELFLNWFVTVVCRDLSKENKVEIMRELGKLHLEEAEKVVSNMAQTWRKMYDDALLAGKAEGKAEGKIEGEKLTAVKHAKSMLIKEMNEELIAEITGLTLVEIRKLRAEARILESKN